TAAFKLTGFAVAGVPALALVLRPPWSLWRAASERPEQPSRALELGYRALLAAALPIAALLFIRLNPYLFSDFRTSFPELERILRVYREGHVRPITYREAGFPHLASALYFIFAQAFSTHPLAALAISLSALGGLGLAVSRASPALVIGALHALALVVGM